MSEADDLDELLGIEVITITLDPAVGVPQVDLGKVTIATAISILELVHQHLKIVMPTPTIVSDGDVIMAEYCNDDDEDDYDFIEGLDDY